MPAWLTGTVAWIAAGVVGLVLLLAIGLPMAAYVLREDPERPVVMVNAKPSPSEELSPGSPVTFVWRSKGATSIRVEPWGAKGPNGEETEFPTQTTTYVFTAIGPGGESDPQTIQIRIKKDDEKKSTPVASATQAPQYIDARVIVVPNGPNNVVVPSGTSNNVVPSGPVISTNNVPVVATAVTDSGQKAVSYDGRLFYTDGKVYVFKDGKLEFVGTLPQTTATPSASPTPTESPRSGTATPTPTPSGGTATAIPILSPTPTATPRSATPAPTPPSPTASGSPGGSQGSSQVAVDINNEIQLTLVIDVGGDMQLVRLPVNLQDPNRSCGIPRELVERDVRNVLGNVQLTAGCWQTIRVDSTMACGAPDAHIQGATRKDLGDAIQVFRPQQVRYVLSPYWIGCQPVTPEQLCQQVAAANPNRRCTVVQSP